MTHDPATDPHQLTVMTFNIHHGVGSDRRLDLERTAAVIAAAGADIVFAQELDRRFASRSDFVDQPAELARLLGDQWQVRFQPNLTRTESATAGYGTAIFSRFPFSGRPTHLRLANKPGFERRGALRTVVTIGASKLRLIGTHLQCRFHGKPEFDQPTQQLRTTQVQEIVAAAGTKTPIIIGGDFNAPMHSQELTELRAKFRGVDAAKTRVYADGTSTAIDHLFVSSDIEVDSVTSPATDASDHRPLIAQLRL